jgi:hypothetical protein
MGEFSKYNRRMDLSLCKNRVNHGGGPTFTFQGDGGMKYLLRVSNTVFTGYWTELSEEEKMDRAKKYLMKCLHKDVAEDENMDSCPLFVLDSKRLQAD